MNTLKQAELLAELRFLDQLEIEAIDSVLARIGDAEPAPQLEKAREDHRRHMREIDALFGECGEEMHPHVPDALKNAAEQRLAAVRSAEGEDEALRALLACERADHAAYLAADAARLPADEGPAMHAHLGDERKHVAAIEKRLRG